MYSLARLLLLTVLLWAALAARAASPVSNTFLYVPVSGTIRAYRTNSDGTLADLPPLRLAAYPIDIAAHPSGKYLYAATVDDQMHKGTVWAVRVRPNGTLEPMRGSTTRIKGSLGQVVVHPRGRLLYVTGEEGRILVFAIRDDGSLRRLPDTRVHDTFTIGHGPSFAVWENTWLSFAGDGRIAYMYSGRGYYESRNLELQTYRVGRNGRLIRWGAKRYNNTFGGREIEPRPEATPIEIIPGRYLAALISSAGTYLCPIMSNGTLNFKRAWKIKNPLGESDHWKYLMLVETDPKGRFLYLALDGDEAAAGGRKHHFFVSRIGTRGQTSRAVPLAVDGVLLAAPNGKHLYSARVYGNSAKQRIDKFTIHVHRLRANGTVDPARPLGVTLPGDWQQEWLMVERRP